MVSSTASVIKTLIVPAVVALILYLALAYGVVPAWRLYRERYSQYIPLNSISNRTSGLRHRVTDGIANLVFSRPWRRNDGDEVTTTDGASDDGASMDGEELGTLDDERIRRLVRSARASMPDNTRRLSRDLEEGFMDDSDEEEVGTQAQGARISLR